MLPPATCLAGWGRSYKTDNGGYPSSALAGHLLLRLRYLIKCATGTFDPAKGKAYGLRRMKGFPMGGKLSAKQTDEGSSFAP